MSDKTVRISLANYSSLNPYVSFEAGLDGNLKIIKCANWTPFKKGRWRCKLALENEKTVIENEFISPKNTGISHFLDDTQHIIDEAGEELGSFKRVFYQIFLLSESSTKRKASKKKKKR